MKVSANKSKTISLNELQRIFFRSTLDAEEQNLQKHPLFTSEKALKNDVQAPSSTLFLAVSEFLRNTKIAKNHTQNRQNLRKPERLQLLRTAPKGPFRKPQNPRNRRNFQKSPPATPKSENLFRAYAPAFGSCRHRLGTPLRRFSAPFFYFGNKSRVAVGRFSLTRKVSPNPQPPFCIHENTHFFQNKTSESTPRQNKNNTTLYILCSTVKFTEFFVPLRLRTHLRIVRHNTQITSTA